MNAGFFGTSVASLGSSVAIGCAQERVSGQSDAGKVHLFRTSNGTHLFSVENPTPSSGEYFGEWLAGESGVVVAGAPRALGDSNGTPGVGMVYAIAENRPPTVSPSSVSTSEDVPLDIIPSMTDLNGDTLTFHAVIGPFQGSVVGTSGEFTYTPNEAYSGPDAFQFYANDACHDSPTTAQITITVNPINDPPVAVDDGPYVVNEDGLLSVGINTGVLDNDSDEDSASFTAVLNQDVANGTLNLDADGSFTYTPDPNFSGADSFTYYALDDGSLSSNIATATITVNPLNDAPTAVADAYTTNEDVPLVVGTSGVLVNDSDPDPGALLTAVLQTGVSNGSLSLSSNGNFTYTPVRSSAAPIRSPTGRTTERSTR